MSRSLGPAEYGSVAALLGLVLVGAVPATALQAVVARRVTGAPGPQSAALALRYGGWVGVLVALVVAAASPWLASFLRLTSAVPVLWVAASLAPFAVTSAAQGILQGTERFARLAVVFAAAAALRLGFGTLGALWHGVLGAMAGTAIAALLAVVVSVLLIDRAGLGAVRIPRGWAVELGHVILAVGGLLVLANLDLLLARHYLPAAVAGLYAVGSLAARATYFAPQFVSVAAFSRFTDAASRRRLLPRALAFVAALGTLATGLAWLVAEPVLRAVFGERYAALAPALWWFALLGSLQALAQLLISAGIAAEDRVTPMLVWTGVVVEALLIATVGHGSLTAIVQCAVATSALIVGALALQAAAVLRR